jgi:hypothetical protein
MTLSSGVVGARHTAQRITWYKENSTTGYDLTGATITARIQDRNGIGRAADGVFTPDADQVTNPGVFTWAYGALDVGTAGDDYHVQFIASYVDSKNDKTFIADWKVVEAL